MFYVFLVPRITEIALFMLWSHDNRRCTVSAWVKGYQRTTKVALYNFTEFIQRLKESQKIPVVMLYIMLCDGFKLSIG